MRRTKPAFCLFAIVFVGLSCADREIEGWNELSEREMAEGWILLFDGETTKGWRGYNHADVSGGWVAKDHMLVCLGKGGDTDGDIVTEKQYENFELKLEWNISKAGNSGIFYHVIEDSKYSATYETGPEYQLIDDVGFPEKLEPWQKTGADYAMYIPNEKKKLNPAGEWNSTRLVFDNGHVEHWLNGERIVEFEAWSEHWNKRRMEGKWKDYPDYGTAREGHIGLQDHGDKIRLRNIKIRPI